MINIFYCLNYRTVSIPGPLLKTDLEGNLQLLMTMQAILETLNINPDISQNWSWRLEDGGLIKQLVDMTLLSPLSFTSLPGLPV